MCWASYLVTCVWCLRIHLLCWWLRKLWPHELHQVCHSELWRTDGCQRVGKKPSCFALLLSFISAQCHWGKIFCRNQNRVAYCMSTRLLYFPIIYFLPLFSLEGLWVLCANHFSGLWQETVSPPRALVPQLPGPSVPSPVPKAGRRTKGQEINSQLLPQGAAGVHRSFPGSEVRGSK